MISRLEVHEEMEDLIVCPSCGNFAKKELLEEWLKRKGYCPICRTILTLSECKKVRFI